MFSQQDLDPWKSAGPDNLPPYFLRLAAHIIAQPVSNIFSLSIQSSVIPDVWKTAYMLPLLKGGDRTLLNNYRPISKLSILAKVLETQMNDQVKDYLSLNNILCPFQSGFRKQHSTAAAAIKVINDMLEAMDAKKYCVARFIDLSKAFDTVDHSILRQQPSTIGMSDHAVGWFSKQCVQSLLWVS